MWVEIGFIVLVYGVLFLLFYFFRGYSGYNEMIIYERPNITFIENFITEEEAAYLMKFGDENKKKSEISNNEQEYEIKYDESIRSSESAYLGKHMNEMVTRIEDRACRYVGTNTHYLEPLQVVVYEKGQKFSPHYDFYSTKKLPKGGNRTKTILVYLNDVPTELGGGTVFTKLGIKIQPKARCAIYFENMNENGPDYDTEHAGEELSTDSIKKYALNIWFTEYPEHE